MSPGLISAMEPAVIGIPSMTYKGSLVALIERLPRIRISPNSPGRLFEVISTPVTRPCIACNAFCTGRSSITLLVTLDIAPVTSLFFAVP